jgi:hypothetical protein
MMFCASMGFSASPVTVCRMCSSGMAGALQAACLKRLPLAQSKRQRPARGGASCASVLLGSD